MYRIGEPAKMAEVTPDMTRYYEEQQVMEYGACIEGRSRLYIESGLQRLKFIHHVRQPGFSPEPIRELLSIRIGPEYHTCQESKGVMQERLQEIEARITELQSMQRFLQRPSDAYCGTTHSSVYCSILEALEQGVGGIKSGCRFSVPVGLHLCRKITNRNFYEPISVY